MKNTIVSLGKGALGSLFAMALYTIIEWYWGDWPDNAQITLIISFICIGISFFLLLFLVNKVEARIRPQLEQEIEKKIAKKYSIYESPQCGFIVEVNRLSLMKNYGIFFEESKNNILIIGETLVTFLQYPNFRDIISETINRGVKIDIIILDKNYTLIADRALELNYSVDEFKVAQLSVINQWKSFKNSIRSSNFRIFLTKFHPRMFFFHIDDKIFFQTYPYGLIGTELPCLCVDKKGNEKAYLNLTKIESNIVNDSKLLNY